jgi:hypothetical protein
MAIQDDRLEPGTRLRFVTVSESFFGIKGLDGPFEASHPVPWIPIVGDWLDAAGFKVDQPVELTISSGKIVIKSLVHCE